MAHYFVPAVRTVQVATPIVHEHVTDVKLSHGTIWTCEWVIAVIAAGHEIYTNAAAARMKDEELGLKSRRRGLAGLSLTLIIVPLILALLVPWARDMSGFVGFLLGLLVAWGIWRLVEHDHMEERFRKAPADERFGNSPGID